jgi:hypothetical protein
MCIVYDIILYTEGDKQGSLYFYKSPSFIHSNPLFLEAGAFFAHARKSIERLLQAAIIKKSPRSLLWAEVLL